jgi:ribokinase
MTSRTGGPVRVCVVGSVNMDLVVHTAKLPAPGETVTGGAFSQVPGGKGANQALAARRAGADVRLVAAVGDDAFGNAALDNLRRDGVDVAAVSVLEAQSTGVALITVDAMGENQISVASGANHRLDLAGVDVSRFDAVLSQLEIPDSVIIEAARQASGLFVLNVAPSRSVPPSVLARADVVIANQGEHTAMAEQLAHFEGLLVVTLGAQGAVAIEGGREVARAEPPAVDVVDAVGAGDAFCGSLAVDLGGGMSVVEALSRACTAGALATTRHGAQGAMPTAAEISRHVPAL